MKFAPLHPNEKERQAALKRLKLLDTLPEKEFDDLTLIASQICNTPIAIISLVDDSRQWFKSITGLEGITGSSREIAFCAHAILQDNIFEIPDSREDERFKDNPFVTAKSNNIVFYAGAPLLSPDGYPIGTLCVIDHKPRTLTPEQSRALASLSAQVQKLIELRVQATKMKEQMIALEYRKTALESLTEGIILIGKDTRVVDFNPAALQILGLTADELYGQPDNNTDWNTFREDGSVCPVGERSGIFSLQTGQPIKNNIRGIIRPDKKVRWLRVNSTPIFMDGGKVPTHAVTIFTDITDEKKLEDDRRQLQNKMVESARLSTLGEMAGGIAHEINTPLASILMLTEMLSKRIPDPESDQQDILKKVKRIHDTALRIAKIVKGLKFFSRNSGNDPMEPFLANVVVEATLDLCREKMTLGQIDLALNIEDNLSIFGRSTEISQVLMNLIGNSMDAVESLPEKWIHIKAMTENDKIIISVTDSGRGIPSMVVDKMMNPFFTTKEVGKGTGLGLSISTGIIQSHDGRLFYDEIGRASCRERVYGRV